MSAEEGLHRDAGADARGAQVGRSQGAPGFLERHRIVGVAAALGLLVAIGLGLGEVLGRLLVELAQLGLGTVEGDGR